MVCYFLWAVYISCSHSLLCICIHFTQVWRPVQCGKVWWSGCLHQTRWNAFWRRIQARKGWWTRYDLEYSLFVWNLVLFYGKSSSQEREIKGQVHSMWSSESPCVHITLNLKFVINMCTTNWYVCLCSMYPSSIKKDKVNLKPGAWP